MSALSRLAIALAFLSGVLPAVASAHLAGHHFGHCAKGACMHRSTFHDAPQMRAWTRCGV